MPLIRFLRAPMAVSPSFVGLATWVLVAILYSLHLSYMLQYSTEDVALAVLVVVGPIALVAVFSRALYGVNSRRLKQTVVAQSPPIKFVESQVQKYIRIWIIFSIVETIVSGGLPIVWIWTGSGKTNFDYGIPSIHGLVDSLLLALAAASAALYLYTAKRKHLWFPLFAIVWSLALVSRGTLFVLIVEYVVIYFRFRTIRWVSFIQILALSSVLLLIFGFVGDFRSGAEAFLTLAQPTPDFPAWAPSGLLWAYIYITSPINNLLLTMHTIHPSYNLLLPNTAATLFPTVLRNIVYGKQGADQAVGGALVVQALNVSTAYAGPFQDMGRWGMVAFSTLLSFLCEVFWRRTGFRNILYFAVFTQALMLSLFFNLLFALPILGQLIWFHYFTHQKSPKQTRANQLRIANSKKATVQSAGLASHP